MVGYIILRTNIHIYGSVWFYVRVCAAHSRFYGSILVVCARVHSVHAVRPPHNSYVVFMLSIACGWRTHANAAMCTVNHEPKKLQDRAMTVVRPCADSQIELGSCWFRNSALNMIYCIMFEHARGATFSPSFECITCVCSWMVVVADE